MMLILFSNLNVLIFPLSTGLRKVMRLAGVNARETVSNHVLEMFDVLGIEAARNCIIDQIKLTMSNQGMRIDLRHIMLLADEMTVSVSYLEITKQNSLTNRPICVCPKYIDLYLHMY